MNVVIEEIWGLNNALCLLKRGMSNVSVSPIPDGVTVTESVEFVTFSEPLSGEFVVTGMVDESKLLTESSVSLVSQLSKLADAGITYVSGFNDLAVSFSKERRENVIHDSDLAVIGGTFDTFFTRLISARIVEEIEEVCTPYELLIKVTGADYTSPIPLVPILNQNGNAVKLNWNNIHQLTHVVVTTEEQTQTSVKAYDENKTVTIPSANFTIGASYCWVDDSFELFSPPIPEPATKIVLVGVATSLTNLQLSLSILFN